MSLSRKNASTQWRPQHVRKASRGIRHPHAWVPPGLHVVAPPNQHKQEFNKQGKVICPIDDVRPFMQPLSSSSAPGLCWSAMDITLASSVRVRLSYLCRYMHHSTKERPLCHIMVHLYSSPCQVTSGDWPTMTDTGRVGWPVHAMQWLILAAIDASLAHLGSRTCLVCSVHALHWQQGAAMKLGPAFANVPSGGLGRENATLKECKANLDLNPS